MARLKARIIHLETREGHSACGRELSVIELTRYPNSVTCKNCKRHLRREERLRAAFGPEAVRLLYLKGGEH